MGLLGIKLSAVPAVILILSVGIGAEFTIHIMMSFVGCIGDRKQRTILALEHMFAPVVHSALSTFLGVLMLAFSQFDFIVRYFFLVLAALILLGLFNGLVFLPVLLVMLGPPAQVEPSGEGSNPDSLPPCTPELPPPKFKVKLPKPAKSSSSSHKPKRHNSDLSLSTIAEETHSQDSFSSNGSYASEPE